MERENRLNSIVFKEFSLFFKKIGETNLPRFLLNQV
jgi:hypothetical protein